MKYAIMVTESLPEHQCPLTALHFIKALYAKRHEVMCVFFYQNGVYNANQLVHPPSDEPQILKQWQALAKNHHVKLICCVASALRRGIIDKHEAKLAKSAHHNLADEFTLGGLGQWIDISVSADKVMVFH